VDSASLRGCRTWLSAASWAVIVGLYVAFMLRHPWHPAHYVQQSDAIVALIHGHLAAVYPTHNTLTSPPGFLLLAAPVVAALGGVPAGGIEGPFVGMLSALSLAMAALLLARTVHPERAEVRDRLLVAAVLFASPFTNGLVGAYHPEDSVAMAFILLAVRAALRRQTNRVGLALAAALLTRQWSILAVGPAPRLRGSRVAPGRRHNNGSQRSGPGALRGARPEGPPHCSRRNERSRHRLFLNLEVPPGGRKNGLRPGPGRSRRLLRSDDARPPPPLA